MDEIFPLKPLSNYIVVQVVPKKKDSKIIRPETVKQPLTPEEVECVVIVVSEECEKDGTPMVRMIKVGDKVIFSQNVRHTGEAIMIKNKEYILCRENDIIGIQIGDFTSEPATNLTLVN